MSVWPSCCNRHEGGTWQWYESVSLVEAWQPHWSNVIPSANAADVAYEVAWPYCLPAYGEKTSAPLNKTPTPPPCMDRSLEPLDETESIIGSSGTVTVVGVP